MKTVAIIQARMGSSRLPGKVLAEAAGKPLLQHMIERLMSCETLDDIVVAIPKTRENEPIASLIADIILEDGYESKVGWVGGDELDVLGRVLGAAQKLQADVIVELTGDCPLIDPALVDLVVERYRYMTRALRLDMLSTSRDSRRDHPAKPYFPRGMDVRVFPREVLEDLDKLTVGDPVSREHVSLYAWEHPRRFWVANLPVREEDGRCSEARLTVDTPEDLELVRKIFGHFSPKNDFGLADILHVLDEHPEWRAINENVRQKEVR